MYCNKKYDKNFSSYYYILANVRSKMGQNSDNSLKLPLKPISYNLWLAEKLIFLRYI